MFRNKFITILIAGIFLLTACGGSAADITPTVDTNTLSTQIVETFAAGLTQTAAAQPTIQLFPTLTASPTIALFTTSVATFPPVSQATIAPTTSCYSMAFVSDVTIPDNTPVTPGQVFTKTWKVTNNGSCAWDAGFKFAFTAGDAMSGVAYTLPSAVAVNATIDIPITMTAPLNKTGKVQGNWRMSTAGGQFFGNEVFVIVVIGGLTGTPTVTATSGLPVFVPTATATATATPITPAP
jgi:hypothetical protein